MFKKYSVDKDSFKCDMNFLKDQKSNRLMTLGAKDRLYSKLKTKRDAINAKHDEYIKSIKVDIDVTAEFEFTSGASDTSEAEELNSSDCE